MVDTSYIFSKPTECTTPRVNPNVNYGLWMLMMCQRESMCSSTLRSIGLWWGMLMPERLCMCVLRGRKYGKSLYFPLNFVASILL